jgi:microcompartment protein CcmK/EutM
VTLCKVIGDIVSTAKHPDYTGTKLMICQPVDEGGKAVGESILAVDRAQAGPGDTVLVMREGNGVRQLFGKQILPIRSIIIGIVDHVDVAAAARAN